MPVGILPGSARCAGASHPTPGWRMTTEMLSPVCRQVLARPTHILCSQPIPLIWPGSPILQVGKLRSRLATVVAGCQTRPGCRTRPSGL